MKKSRSLPTYHGFHGQEYYYSSHGLQSYGPCMMGKTPPGMSDAQKWTDYFGNPSKCLNWHLTGAECPLLDPIGKVYIRKVYNGYEEIDSLKGYGKFNACSHYKRHAVILPCHFSLRLPGKGNLSITRFWKFAFGTYNVPVFSSHQGDAAGAARRAWWTMQPRFEGRISMINFLYELKDIKQLVKEAQHIFNMLKNFRRTIERAKALLRRGNVDPSKPIAELYLTKEFGIDPLLKDLTDIFSQIAEKINEVQQKFADKGNEENTRHYSEDLSTSSSLSAPSKTGYTVTGSKSKTVFNATMSYYYDYEMRDFSHAFLKYWGLNGSAEALWNMIPFSFIADYFVKIGKALHTMEVDKNVKLKDYLYCESLKTTMSAGIYFQRGTDLISFLCHVDGEPSSDGALVTGYEVTRYDRYPTVPNKGTALPRLNNLTDRQLTNMGALLRSFF